MTEKQTEATGKFIDPICGMTVSPESARGALEVEGQKYYFCSKGCLETFKRRKGIADAPIAQTEKHYSREEMREDKTGTEIDPICGMTVNPATAAGSFNHAGKTYYFCSAGCLQKFVAQSQGAPLSGFVGISRAKKETVQHGEMTATPKGEYIDPVCGMSVASETAAGKYDYKGETFYFCSTGCLNKFKQNPAIFLEKKKEESQSAEASESVEYTCPMHPEIVQIGPGSCPKCGMALEPKVLTLDDKPDPEYVDMKRRFWISAVLTIPVFVLAMAEMLPNFHALFSPKISLWIQFVLATPVVLWGGFPFFVRGWQSIGNRSPNMFTLIAIGTGAAYIFSLFALFLPDLFPASIRN